MSDLAQLVFIALLLLQNLQHKISQAEAVLQRGCGGQWGTAEATAGPLRSVRGHQLYRQEPVSPGLQDRRPAGHHVWPLGAGHGGEVHARPEATGVCVQ